MSIKDLSANKFQFLLDFMSGGSRSLWSRNEAAKIVLCNFVCIPHGVTQCCHLSFTFKCPEWAPNQSSTASMVTALS